MTMETREVEVETAGPEELPFRRIPLDEKAQVTLFLFVALFCVLVFLVAVPLYVISPPEGSRAARTHPSISQMCSDAASTGEGRLFSVSMLIAGFCVLFSFFECHLEPVRCCCTCCACGSNREKRNRVMEVVLHCIFSVSLIGVGSLPHDQFGRGMDILHGVCSAGTFILHPVLDIMRLFSLGEVKTKLQWARLLLAMFLMVMLCVYGAFRFMDEDKVSFWVEYAMTWGLVVELILSWVWFYFSDCVDDSKSEKKARYASSEAKSENEGAKE